MIKKANETKEALWFAFFYNLIFSISMLISSSWKYAQDNLNSINRNATFQFFVSLRVLQYFL